MNLIQEWVKALRSGDYKQGQGSLLLDGKYCCLGVFQDVAHKMGLCPPVEEGHGYLYGTAHQLFIKNMGVKSIVHFVNLNDRLLFTFNQIAEEIEREHPCSL